jgi:hypothetical protein
MSASGTGCTCGRLPYSMHWLAHWVVVRYHCNYSAFNGYHYTPSDYSLVSCLKCGHHWRTKAKYVDRLYKLTDLDRRLWSRRELTLDHLSPSLL